ncbi:MAG: alpha-2-macroglobulin family protein [Flavobacterium sp.]|uniref:alpha-2-macroglobulin family protein n=1 Tax=Flavobacterium sp. TaxID=239 RepID=UPI0032664A1F
MKHLFTIALLILFSRSFAQDFKQEWKEVIQFELDGKIKSAHQAVDAIYKKAKKKKIENQIIKCFFYQSKFIQVSDENAQKIILNNLNHEIKNAKGSQKALLNYIYATLLEKYYQNFRYTINQKTALAETDSSSKDWKTWTPRDFDREINNAYQNLLKDEKQLRATNINEFASVFEIAPYTDTKKLSIYDFLLKATLKYRLSKWYISDSKKYVKTSRELFKKSTEFAQFRTDTITDEGLKAIIELYQNNEKYCLKNNNDDINILQHNRMKGFETYFNDREYYFSKLSELEEITTNNYLIQDIRIEKAQYYFSLTSKGNAKNYDSEVLAIVENILNTSENPNAKAEAETLKEKILGKKITLNIKDKLYPNQNFRAFVESKNVDSLQLRYYKIPIAILKKLTQSRYYGYGRNKKNKAIDKDSLVFDYIEKHQPAKTSIKVIPTKGDHYQYTSEILMDNLDLGSYLLFFDLKNPFGYPEKKAFAYQVIQVSNIDFVKEREGDYDVFQLLNRKTGQPVENAVAINDDSTRKSNKNGTIHFEFKPKGSDNLYSDLLFVTENDTLYSNYYMSTKYDLTNDYEGFEAKSMVFFDRAIYRPGQKVYFKGFMIKNKKKVKSVVPNLTVHIIITNAQDDDVKEFDLQTNEFGSFTGEYEIPKNVLTGDFKISIEEPLDNEVDTKYYDKEKDEHSFWDNANYNENSRFGFKVEEYKRPTFEVVFDKIKENYTVGDTIIVSGNAKTLAGSNLTNAKVSYTVSKNILGKEAIYSYKQNYINTETTTDGNGNFKIEFEAVQDSLSLDDIETFYFNIKAEITDLNGETRTAVSDVTVGQKMLKLNCTIPNYVIQEDAKSLQVNATTLNNFPINAKGTITLFERNQKEYLIKKERLPELNAIDRKQFEALFPFEAYDKEDNEIKENKILTIPFDTQKSTDVDLAFLKKYKLGLYKIVVEAKDQKGNPITSENYFELASKNKKPSNKTLFTFNQLDKEKEYFVYEIKSVIPDLYVTTRFFDNNRKKSETVIQLKNGYGVVKFPKAANYESDIQFHFSSVWENTYYSEFTTISNEDIETKLEFEIRSMRNKIEPGSNENWSFIIKNSKMQAEVLASMYDVSLDEFAIKNWNVERFYTGYSFPEISHQTQNWYGNETRFSGLYFYSKFYKTYIREPEIQWFGFDFNNRSNYANTEYLKKYGPDASIPKNARTVYGIVSDKTGPIPGVNVVVKGTNRGTQTDFDGYYQFDVENGEVLVISFVGMQDENVVVGKEKNIDIRLKEGVSLEEVVIQTNLGYYKKEKNSLTSAVTTVSGEEFDKEAPSLAFRNAIQGKAAGVQVIIRGNVSITGTYTGTLYVVDGLLVDEETASKINQGDIDNINVLKDTAAIAMYGSKAGNGVIIINTKKGMKELQQVKTRTNFNETAFFYPNLTTDAEGKISFSFTTPESLTKWRMRLFAHNKKAETGYFQADIVSQKDIMVMPNMPRFVRENDTINLALKVVNLTMETKTGNAILLLFDAATNNPIDAITLNKDNTKPFICKAKQSVVVNWLITIPEGVQGLRYKVIAKSGMLSDGEENILPVLTNKILITESIPIWVRGNTKREFTFANLKNNTSTTLQNHALTFEYTSNPIWMALQSLPYLMNYPHECAEQTFAKYYANCIAEKIITSNPKAESLLKKWHDKKLPESRLKLNDELKSIVLAETPWLLDAESDEQANQRLALLMDLNSLKENNEKAFSKIENLILPSGGFAWFSGGNENRYISQHILSGIGHLNKLFPADSLKYKNIVSKGIPNLDSKFVGDYFENKKIRYYSTVNLNYLYTRSFFIKEYPLSKKCDSIIKLQLNHCKEDWLGYGLYEKGLLALIMNRFNEKDFAKKIIASLRETVSNNEEIGMYWIENRNGCNWYQSNIETHCLLIEAFAEIDKNKETIDAMKVWLIKNKQANNWPTTKSTTEAIYALLYQGNDWTSLKENTKIKIGDEKILTQKLLKKDDELDSGYLKIRFDGKEIDSKMGTITVDNKTKVPGFGGVYWQYFENLENIKVDSTNTLVIDKKMYKKVKTTKGDELVALKNESVKVGDLLTVRLIIKTDTDLEFVHLKDLRASCLEPVDVISGYVWQSGLGYYKSTKDVATHFFFDNIHKGTYVLEYDLRVTNKGVFNNGISTLQSMYAPEFGTHSLNTKINVKE